MNFPMEYPIFQFFYWLVNTGGVGGAVVLLIAVIVTSSYALTLRWIAAGAKESDGEGYAFPPHE